MKKLKKKFIFKQNIILIPVQKLHLWSLMYYQKIGAGGTVYHEAPVIRRVIGSINLGKVMLCYVMLCYVMLCYVMLGFN